MGIIMKGAEVATAMKDELLREIEDLSQKGVIPCLGIVRVGAKPDDLAYEKSTKKKT